MEIGIVLTCNQVVGMDIDYHRLEVDEYAQARSGQMAIQAGISGEIMENQVSLKMLFLQRLDRERILNDL